MSALLRSSPPALLLGLTVFSGSARAQCNQNEIATLVPPNCTVAAADSLDVDGPVLVMGAIGTSCAHVYRHDGVTWNYEQEVRAADTKIYDRFGDAVAVQGNWLMVGAINHQHHGGPLGVVHVFEFDGLQWQERQELSLANGQTATLLGWSLSLDGSILAAGAPYADTAHGPDTGSVYLFEESGGVWSETAEVLPVDLDYQDEFGHAVALEGSTLVVGAYKDDDEGVNAGAAYVFRNNGGTWQEEQKLVGSLTSQINHFGWSVAVSGSDVLIGSRLDNKAAGSAYLFRFDGSVWQEQTRLLAPDRENDDEFGTSVAIRDGLALVGAPQEDTVGNNVGAVYVYRDTGSAWVDVVKLTPSNALPGVEQGNTLALDDTYLYAGAPTRDPGQVFVYQSPGLALEVSPATANVGDPVTLQVCGGLPGSLSLLYVIDASGIGLFVQVARLPLDAAGGAALTGPVPPALAGVQLTFQAFGFIGAGQLAASFAEVLVVP